MALVTTCPHCGTSFRIVADQLKLRGGLVRCGSCLAVFSGLEKMSRVDDAIVGAATGEASGEATEPTAEGEATAPAPTDSSEIESGGPAGTWDDDGPLPGEIERRDRLPDLPPPDDIPSFGIPAAEDLASRISDADRAAFEQAKLERARRANDDRPGRHSGADSDIETRDRAIGSQAAAIDSARKQSDTDRTTIERAAAKAERASVAATATDHSTIADNTATDHSATATDLDADLDPDLDADLDLDPDAEVAIGDEEMAIDYFSADERRRGFLGQHAFLKLATAGVLVLALIVQAVLANRDWLAARLPALEPAIAAISAPFGASISPPRSIGSLSIESFELQTDAASELLAVSAIIHNAARHPVRWPSMMLTLTDAQSRVLVRKAIDPADYLSASNDVALRPNSERPIRLALEAQDIRPAGYSVVLFYR